MPSTEKSPPTEQQAPRLTFTQVIASALAAVTATFAASYFGVSGTVIGAGLASVVTVVGNALYSRSIQRTKQRVRSAVPVGQPFGVTAIRPSRQMPKTAEGAGTRSAAGQVSASEAAAEQMSASAGEFEPESASGTESAQGSGTEPASASGTAPGDATTQAGKSPSRDRWRVTGWRRLALGAVGLFVLVAGIVTVVELAAGRPLTSILHDQSGNGTSLFGGSTKSNTPTTPSPSPASSTAPTAPSTATPPTTPAPSRASQVPATPTTPPTAPTAQPSQTDTSAAPASPQPSFSPTATGSP